MREYKLRVRGYTLTELLIVMAIFGLLTALAIPALGRAGGFLSDDPDLAGRELYSSLRAAKVHAATYRMDTALVYGLVAPKDSLTGTATPVIDSYCIARRLNAEELKMLEDQALDAALEPVVLPPDPSVAPAFVMVRDRNAAWRKLPAKACVLSIDNADPPVVGIVGDLQTDREGLVSITLYESYEGVDSDNVTPRTIYRNIEPGPDPENHLPVSSGLSAAVIAYAFPAHIFLPSGLVEPQDSPVARLTLNVGPVPDASPQDRFAVAPGDVDPASGSVDNDGVWKTPVRIELFRTTGRVKITS